MGCAQTAFHDGVAWLTFGKDRTAVEMLRKLVSKMGITNEEIRQLRTEDELLYEVQQRLSCKRWLIVLDDVWHEQQPMPFSQLASSTVAVLMTTRKQHIVDRYGESLAQLPLRPMHRDAAIELLVQSSGMPMATQHTMPTTFATRVRGRRAPSSRLPLR